MADPDVIHLALRTAHILFGILWVGALGYSVLVLGRVIPRVEPPARKQVMLQLMPVALKYLPITATGTIAFGVTMYLYLGQLNPAVLFGSVKFLLIFAALLIVLAMFTFGILVVMRTALKIKTHLEEPKCEHMPLVGAMQKLFARGQLAVLAIGMAVVGLMVVASHL